MGFIHRFTKMFHISWVFRKHGIKRHLAFKTMIVCRLISGPTTPNISLISVDQLMPFTNVVYISLIINCVYIINLFEFYKHSFLYLVYCVCYFMESKCISLIRSAAMPFLAVLFQVGLLSTACIWIESFHKRFYFGGLILRWWKII